MRILQVISTPPFAWATGGCARFAYEISRELVRRGHEVTMATTNLLEPGRNYGNLKNPQYMDGIEIHRFSCLWTSLAWRHKIYLSPGLVFYIRDHVDEYDIVHLQDIISVQAMAAMAFCTRKKVPYVLTSHGSVRWLNEPRIVNQCFNALGGRRIVLNAEKVTALTRSEAEQYERAGRDSQDIEIVPNGVNEADFHRSPGKFKNRLGLGAETSMILYMGRLHRSKGLDMVLESFAGVVEEDSNARLVLVGPDDGFKSTLERQADSLHIRDRLFFCGFIPEEERRFVYSDADVLVSPSYSGFPATFLEACASGTPLVTTRAGDELDWIDERVGYVVDFDKDQIRDAILKILANENLKRKFGENGKKLALEEFNWPNVVGRLEHLFRRCVQ